MKYFSWYYKDRFGWFRLFGYGLKFKDHTIYRLTFSERNNLSSFIQIGKWTIGKLKPQ